MTGFLLRLQHAATVDQARDLARQALADGAPPADVAAALIEWDDLHDQLVQTLEAGR